MDKWTQYRLVWKETLHEAMCRGHAVYVFSYGQLVSSRTFIYITSEILISHVVDQITKHTLPTNTCLANALRHKTKHYVIINPTRDNSRYGATSYSVSTSATTSLLTRTLAPR